MTRNSVDMVLGNAPQTEAIKINRDNNEPNLENTLKWQGLTHTSEKDGLKDIDATSNTSSQKKINIFGRQRSRSRKSSDEGESEKKKR